VILCLSISGFPLLSGFTAKTLALKTLVPAQAIAMNLAAVGTVIVFAKFIFLPHKNQENIQPSLWPALLLLMAGLIAADAVSLEVYTFANIAKALTTISIGWLAYFLIFQQTTLKLPRVLEEFEHLIGVMSLMLIALFWMVLA
jgi:multicomponent Na+:H+ antiporter subunit D